MTTTYSELAAEVGLLVSRKAASYGRATATAADHLALDYPEGIPRDKYEDACIAMRVYEKLARVAHDKGAFGESPWLDIAGHGLVGLMRDRCAREKA